MNKIKKNLTRLIQKKSSFEKSKLHKNYVYYVQSLVSVFLCESTSTRMSFFSNMASKATSLIGKGLYYGHKIVSKLSENEDIFHRVVSAIPTVIYHVSTMGLQFMAQPTVATFFTVAQNASLNLIPYAGHIATGIKLVSSIC